MLSTRALRAQESSHSLPKSPEASVGCVPGSCAGAGERAGTGQALRILREWEPDMFFSL